MEISPQHSACLEFRVALCLGSSPMQHLDVPLNDARVRMGSPNNQCCLRVDNRGR